MITLEEFKNKKLSLNQMHDEFGINSWHLEPFDKGWNYNMDVDELREKIEALRLSIELFGVRYSFENLRSYKAFKKHFNLL